MSSDKDTEEAMVRALERRERAKSAETGIFGIVFIAACALLLTLSVHFNWSGWYVVGGTFICMAGAGIISNRFTRGAREREPGKY